MRVFSEILTNHEEIIHDVSYDFYGRRLVTCSSDRKIKVFNLSDKEEWYLSYEWTSHQGSIWKVAWAHPQYGQVIASCSFDRSVVIWEEEEDTTGQKSWKARATLVDSRDSVCDIKFAPPHLGLKLASCSGDGLVRIYEAIDVMNLAHWSLTEDFEVSKSGCTCIAWNPSPVGPQCLVVGTSDVGAKVYEYNSTYRRWTQVEALLPSGTVHDVAWAPSMGRSYSLIAAAFKDTKVRIFTLHPSEKQGKYEVQNPATLEGHGAEVWRVSWNITGTILASSGDDGIVHLWKQDYTGQWRCLSRIPEPKDQQ